MFKTGWIVENKNGICYFIKKFLFIGSFMKIQRPEKIRYQDIKILSEKYRVFQIIIEPASQYQVSSIKCRGFKQTKSPYLPSKTLELDLTKSEKTLCKNLKKDTRYALRKTQDLRIKNYDSGEIRKFRNSWRKSVGLKRHVPSEKNLITLKGSFGKNSLFIETSGAGAIFLKTKDRAYYWQAYTGKEGRETLAQYRLVWEGILWAKRAGCKTFDFEGIYDPRFPNKAWHGFTHFKKSFGGAEVAYPGAFSKFRFPPFQK